ncbi:Gfo/Idh/MocA family protein [Planctomycetota bacterium]
MSQKNSKPIKSDVTLTRRRFMGHTAVAVGSVTLPTYIPASALGADGHVAPSNRITLAQIGCGCMGRGHTRRMAFDPAVELLAVCDVDRNRMEATRAQVTEAYAENHAPCAGYNDYREILARDDIDGVVIVTPDHWHTPQSIDAAKAGKDIYCEKPVSITVDEGRLLEQAVTKYGRIFQTGTQYRSIPRIRQVCEYVRAGGLGHVKQVFTIWRPMGGYFKRDCFKPYIEAFDLEAASRSYVPLRLNLPGEPVPEGLDWKRWVGPAPWQDYNPVYHRNPIPGVVPWSFHQDFGVAAVTGYHSHAADVIQYALGMERSGPVEFLHPKESAYPTLTCRYANGTLLHLVEHWDDVKRLYQAVPDDARLAGNFGGLFVGEKGWVTSMTTGGPIEASSEAIFKAMKMEKREPDRGNNNHHDNWFECMRTRQRPSTDAELGHRAAALGHLTIIAYRLGRSLKWDPVKEEFSGDEEANRLLIRVKQV